MKLPLRILHLEDNLHDAELVKETLSSHQVECEITRVETEKDFAAELDRGDYDLILSDYQLPAFDGITALAMAQQKRPDTPYVFFSGNIGEERAIETLKKGATDYVLKQSSKRLAPAVNRALQEAKIKKEHRHLEQQLRQAQKMEAIGKLTGGIAHDFNNMLTIIAGYSDMLLHKLDDAQTLRAGLDEIKKAADKSTALTRQLLAFSRQQVLQPRVIDPREMIMNSSQMFRRLIGEDMELIISLPENLGRIKVDPSQFEQVMLNLIINARDAMSGGGKITLEAGNVHSDLFFRHLHSQSKAGDYVMFAVKDTGVGISDEDKVRIFEPFFTTKGEGRGTGLGLATVFGIITQSGGYIEVDSAPGKGAAFKIYLPRVTELKQAVKSESALDGKRGTETILLAEDEISVCRLMRTILESKGYTVLEAENGAKALSIYNEYKGEIHLLLTDCVMPQISGKELSEKILALNPDVRVLYVSGYMDRNSGNQTILEPSVGFLQKPFSPEKLAQKVREVLDKHDRTNH